MTEPIFFSGWHPLIRVLADGALAYVAMIVMLRFFVKRALTKMSAWW